MKNVNLVNKNKFFAKNSYFQVFDNLKRFNVDNICCNNCWLFIAIKYENFQNINKLYSRYGNGKLARTKNRV